MKRTIVLLSLFLLTGTLAGCWAAAAGVGAEAGYIGAQENRTAAETVDDQRITATVKTKLVADPDTSALDINVDTFKRVVTLKGRVSSAGEAERAVQIARDVSGVKQVRNQLKLK